MNRCKNLKSLSKNELRKFIDSFDFVLCDCDGVLWRETEVIEGSPETVKKLKELDKRFFYITNNNCVTREELVNKCTSQDYAATVDEILCSSYLAACYLKQLNFNKTVYVVGSEGISQELSAQGIKHFGVGPDIIEGNELDVLLNFKRDPEVGAVVVGFDKHFSYPKLVKAATYLADPRVHFIGTNPDVERPSPNESRFPAAGCFLSCIEAITGRKPVVLGKPESFVSKFIMKRYGVDPSRTLIIGDSLNTDILLGKRCGFQTLLVMSGVTRLEDLSELNNNDKTTLHPAVLCTRRDSELKYSQTNCSAFGNCASHLVNFERMHLQIAVANLIQIIQVNEYSLNFFFLSEFSNKRKVKQFDLPR